MQYLGGKSRIAKALAARIREIVPGAKGYWDPFCGGLSMSVALSAYAPVIASDACAPLIALYQAVRDGWVPPSEVSRETWQAAKTLPNSDPLKAFCGFACSFGGVWFGSYTAPVRQLVRAATGRIETSYIHRQGARAVVRDCTSVDTICEQDWQDVDPSPTSGHVLYLDPPYAGTAGYSAVGAFDSAAFVERVRAWSCFAHVFVSEYAFPLGAAVWERALPTKINGKGSGGGGRISTERLYYVAKGSL